MLTDGRTILLLTYAAPPMPPLLLVDTLSLRPASEGTSPAGGIPMASFAQRMDQEIDGGGGHAAMAAAAAAAATHSGSGSLVQTRQSVPESLGAGNVSSSTPPPDAHLQLVSGRPLAPILAQAGGGSGRFAPLQPSSATSIGSSRQASMSLLTMPPTPLAARLVSQRLFSPLRLLRQQEEAVAGTSGGSGDRFRSECEGEGH